MLAVTSVIIVYLKSIGFCFPETSLKDKGRDFEKKTNLTAFLGDHRVGLVETKRPSESSLLKHDDQQLTRLQEIFAGCDRTRRGTLHSATQRLEITG